MLKQTKAILRGLKFISNILFYCFFYAFYMIFYCFFFTCRWIPATCYPAEKFQSFLDHKYVRKDMRFSLKNYASSPKVIRVKYSID